MYRSRPVSASPNTNTLANGWVRVCITIIPSVHVFNGTAEIALLLLLSPPFLLPLPPLLLPLPMKTSKTGEKVFGSHRITIQPDSTTATVRPPLCVVGGR